MNPIKELVCIGKKQYNKKDRLYQNGKKGIAEKRMQ